LVAFAVEHCLEKYQEFQPASEGDRLTAGCAAEAATPFTPNGALRWVDAVHLDLDSQVHESDSAR
jgi:hypothetical protein